MFSTLPTRVLSLPTPEWIVAHVVRAIAHVAIARAEIVVIATDL